MSTITLFGIPNCDSVKKARKWLENNDITFDFHDFRKDGLAQAQVQIWLDALGTSTLVNKRSTTWKQLDEAQQAQALSDEAASLLVEHPTLIKRPVLEHGTAIQVGFKESDYSALFQ